MHVRRGVEADRPALAALAARLQVRPDRHIVYLGFDAATIAAEMVAEDDDWTAAAAVVLEGEEPVGWLMGSVDPNMGRVWWFGPFIDAAESAWVTIADELYETASALLDASVTEEEFAPDARFTELIAWAVERGCHVDPGSAVLSLHGELPLPSIVTRPVTTADLDTVGRLHDELFPSTHTTGATLVSDGDEAHIRLATERDGAVVGYVAAERQADGDGYIDYLGVAPTARRQGLAAELSRAAVAALRLLGCGLVHLTVRAESDGARALYASLGFEEERVVTPLRRGFSLT